jgi:hypothetical protein
MGMPTPPVGDIAMPPVGADRVTCWGRPRRLLRPVALPLGARRTTRGGLPCRLWGHAALGGRPRRPLRPSVVAAFGWICRHAPGSQRGGVAGGAGGQEGVPGSEGAAQGVVGVRVREEDG